MKNLWEILIFSTLIVFSSCNTEPNSRNKNYDELEKKLSNKEQIIDSLKNEIKSLENNSRKVKSETESNPKLNYGNQESIKNYRFIDTLDISDNFYVYDRNVEIIKTTESDSEKVLANFVEYKSIELDGVEVLAMTFLNEVSLPLETENWNTEIKVLVRPFEIGDKNSFFIISDFHYVELLDIKPNGNKAELTFKHGRFPRKTEKLIISYDEINFADK